MKIQLERFPRARCTLRKVHLRYGLRPPLWQKALLQPPLHSHPVQRYQIHAAPQHGLQRHSSPQPQRQMLLHCGLRVVVLLRRRQHQHRPHQ